VEARARGPDASAAALAAVLLVLDPDYSMVRVMRSPWPYPAPPRGATFFYRQMEPLAFTPKRRGTDLRPRGCGAPLPPCLQGRLGVGLDRAAQEVRVVMEGTTLAARVGFRGATAAATKPTPQLLHA
jgi:hypothetical protein